MYKIGDVVAYGSQGICKVEEIATKQIGGSSADYYILKPIYDSRCTVSVPVANPKLTARMRAPLDTPGAVRLVDGMDSAASLWIDDDNKRRENYNSFMTEGDPAVMAALFKTLILRRRELEGLSRKLRTVDENFLHLSEKLLCCELCYAGMGEMADIKQLLISRIL